MKQIRMIVKIVLGLICILLATSIVVSVIVLYWLGLQEISIGIMLFGSTLLISGAIMYFGLKLFRKGIGGDIWERIDYIKPLLLMGITQQT